MDKLNEPDNTMISKEVDEPSIVDLKRVARSAIQNSASLYSLWFINERSNGFIRKKMMSGDY